MYKAKYGCSIKSRSIELSPKRHNQSHVYDNNENQLSGEYPLEVDGDSTAFKKSKTVNIEDEENMFAEKRIENDQDDINFETNPD